MTVLDRILCAFRFHGKSEHVRTVAVWSAYQKEMPRAYDEVMRCTLCGRYHRTRIE